MDTTTTPGGRRGRPPSGQREQRREEILLAAQEDLVEHGYDAVTMLGIAKRAGASKETLYRWFGNKEQLFASLIERDADRTAEAVALALAAGAEPRLTLGRFAENLLSLLTGVQSVVLNRAAMASPELSAVLLASGRHRVGPLVEEYLAELDARGVIDAPSPAAAFELFYGLVIRDRQIRVLLGEKPPNKRDISKEAERAVERFLRLTAP